MTKPNLEEIALHLGERASMLEAIPSATRYMGFPAKRHEQRDITARALIDAVRQLIPNVENGYLRTFLDARATALEEALERVAQNPEENMLADRQAGDLLVKVSRALVPMVPDICAPVPDAEKRNSISHALTVSASAVEKGALAYAYTIFDNSKPAQAWQEAAQQLVDAMLEAKDYLPAWAGIIGMNGNAMSVAPFIKAARSCRGNTCGDQELVKTAKTYADKARTVAAIIV